MHIREETTANTSQKGPIAVLTGLFLAGFLAVIAWNIELPYLAYSTGPVADATSQIRADGVELFPPNGEMLMLTVISQDVNVFEYVVAHFDPTIDLVKKELVRIPGETVAEYRARSLQQMDDSNFRSIHAALTHLGYEMVPFEVSVNEVFEGFPAFGLLQAGDIILEVEGATISSRDDILAQMGGKAPGDSLEVVVLRGGEELALTVGLGQNPDDPERPMIGVLLDQSVRPPFEVFIRTGNVGGPSAGMMHTLAIIDNLTEGELTRGHVIAGTGTMHPDFNVGPIGGVRQKVVAAEAAGAQYILVPVSNYEAALTAPRSRIEIVPIATLQEALDFLAALPDS